MVAEHSEQAAFFSWCLRHHQEYPGIEKIFAIPNGGKRDEGTAIKLKREGVRRGIPDMFLPVARNGRHGLFIEMKKRQGGRVSEDQRIWKAALQHSGYQVEVALGFQEARRIILDYYDGTEACPAR